MPMIETADGQEREPGTSDNCALPVSDNGSYRTVLPAPHTAETQARPPVEGAPLPSDVAGAFAANTRRGYASDWRDWMAWCGERDRNAIPASPADVAEYLRERAARRKMSTIRRNLAAIAQVHRLAGLQLDRNDPALHFALRALAREHGVAVEGKRELMTADIEAMLSTFGKDLAGLRDRALLLVGFAGGFRRSELVALDVGDVVFRRDGMILTIRRSKGDQEGRGQLVGVRYGQRERTCPVRALKRWLEASGLTEGPLFRAILRGRPRDHRLSDKAVWRLVKGAATAAGIDAAAFGAHSLRIGHVTQALANGADPLLAQRQLRHKKLDTTLGYNRAGDALKDNSSSKLGL